MDIFLIPKQYTLLINQFSSLVVKNHNSRDLKITFLRLSTNTFLREHFSKFCHVYSA